MEFYKVNKKIIIYLLRNLTPVKLHTVDTELIKERNEKKQYKQNISIVLYFSYYENRRM